MPTEIRELTHTQNANLSRALAVVDDQIKQAKILVDTHFPGADNAEAVAMTAAIVQALAAAYAGHTASTNARP